MLNIFHHYRSTTITPKELIKLVVGAERNVKEWRILLKSMYYNNFPIKLHLKRKFDSNAVTIHNILQAWLIASGILFKIENDFLTFQFRGREVRFLNSDGYMGDLPGVFCKLIYDGLYVKGREVVDIGSTVGDSVIFFSIKGAEKIISVEPFPVAFRQLKQNIKANGLEDRVVLHNAAISTRTNSLLLDPDLLEVSSVPADNFENGIEVPSVSFQNIASELRTNEAILKMDCEGCEYDAILSSDIDTLSKFRSMMIEYHYGPKLLQNKLIELGYDVKITHPRIVVNRRAVGGKMKVGYIYAERKGSIS